MIFDQISIFKAHLVKILIKIDQISYFLCDLVKILINFDQIFYRVSRHPASRLASRVSRRASHIIP